MNKNINNTRKHWSMDIKSCVLVVQSERLDVESARGKNGDYENNL